MTFIILLGIAAVTYKEIVQMYRDQELPWQNPPWRHTE